MHPRPIRHRRARRTDFDAVAALLAAADAGHLADERAIRSRFRRIVADLGADLYVAAIDDVVSGLVHVTYARHLLEGARARLEMLIVAPSERRRGVGTSLIGLAVERARGRGCERLSCRPTARLDTQPFFAHLGWRIAGEQLEFQLPARAN